MSKIKLIIIILLYTNIVFAQKPHLKIEAKNTKISSKINNNAYLIENKTNKSLYVFLEGKKTTNGFKYDENRNLEIELVSKKIKRKYKNIIGHALLNNKLRLIQKNNNGNKFASVFI